MVEERLTRIFGTTVDVGDVSFAPIDAVVTLRNVTVHPRTGMDLTTSGERVATSTPSIEAGRVRIDLQWLPLLHRSVVVRELAFEEATIDLDGLGQGASGTDSTFETFLRVDPAKELPPDWTFGLDRIALRDTRLRVRDFTKSERPVLDLGVREAEIATRRRRASAFRQAPNLRVDALVEGGRIRIDGHTDLRDDGVAVDALVRMKDVPLDRVGSRLPNSGWSALDGLLSGHFHYQRDPGRRDLLKGDVRIRRVGVRVPAHDGPALAIRRMEVEVDAIDLRHRHLSVGSLMVHGARLAVRADVSAPVPLFDGSPADAAGSTDPRAAKDPRAADPSWTWSIRQFAIPQARLVVAGADEESVLTAAASGENIGPGAYWSPLRGWIARGAGAAVFDGTARLARGLTVDGRITASDLDVPAFARAFGVPNADLIRTGRGSGDLSLEYEPGAKDAAPFDLSGKVTLADVEVAGPKPDEFAIGARAIDLTLAAITPAETVRDTFKPARIRFRDAAVTQPHILVTRGPEGWVWPPFTEEPGELPDGAVAVAGSPAAPPSPPPATPSPAAAAREGGAEPVEPEVPPKVEVMLARVHSNGGHVRILDRATPPDLGLDLDVLEAWAEDVRLPRFGSPRFVLQATDRDLGVIQIGGSTAGPRKEFEVAAQDIRLAAATPYLERAGMPYWFAGGTGSLVARIALGSDRWNADTTLTLQDPIFGGDPLALRDSFGMPIDDAMDALRTPGGDVTLRLPLTSPRDDAPIDRIVGRALRQAVALAQRSPLPDAPIEVAFAPGRVELDGRARVQLVKIANVLQARPDAIVEIQSSVSREDRRFFSEQAAVAYLEEPSGLFGVLRVFGVRDQHARIREALSARAAGYPGKLDDDDEEALRQLAAAAPQVAEDRLTGIAAERARRVVEIVRSELAIPAARVTIAPPSPVEALGRPSVRASIGVAKPTWGAAELAETEREPELDLEPEAEPER